MVTSTACATGVAYPRYAPSDGARLGGAFLNRFRDAHAFLASRLHCGDSLEASCAFDLLEDIAWSYWEEGQPLPLSLTDIDAPIPEPAASEIAGDPSFHEFNGSTVGEFLPFLVENG